MIKCLLEVVAEWSALTQREREGGGGGERERRGVGLCVEATQERVSLNPSG